MAVPAHKDDLRAAIERSFEALMSELRAVPRSYVRRASLDGHAKGSLMSTSDLVAYLIGWNTLVLKWLDYSEAGRAIEFPETGYKWNQLGQLAQKFYADYADLDYPSLLSALDAAKIRIVDQVNIRSNAQLYGQLRYGKHTMGRMIQLNTAAPYKNATARMRRSRKTQAC
ncbi:MAG TPA: hypothetical protein DCQ10_12160 [Rhodobacteraceae bacterium]|nr:hypothetical protein [Paracoccaceae bacterium]